MFLSYWGVSYEAEIHLDVIFKGSKPSLICTLLLCFNLLFKIININIFKSFCKSRTKVLKMRFRKVKIGAQLHPPALWHKFYCLHSYFFQSINISLTPTSLFQGAGGLQLGISGKFIALCKILLQMPAFCLVPFLFRENLKYKGSPPVSKQPSIPFHFLF